MSSAEETLYRIWYWAMIDRASDGRVVASVPDLDDVAASASTEKDALAHLTVLAAERVRAAVEGGQPVPGRRHFNELPSRFRSGQLSIFNFHLAIFNLRPWECK